MPPIKDEGLGHPAAQCHAHPVHQLFGGEEFPIWWGVLGKSQGLARSWQDCHLQVEKNVYVIDSLSISASYESTSETAAQPQNNYVPRV